MNQGNLDSVRVAGGGDPVGDGYADLVVSNARFGSDPVNGDAALVYYANTQARPDRSWSVRAPVRSQISCAVRSHSAAPESSISISRHAIDCSAE
jgi:hypothetical protein